MFAAGNIEWQNDTIEEFSICTDLTGERQLHVQEVISKGKVERGWELEAVMNAIAEQTNSDLEPGRYIIKICW